MNVRGFNNDKFNNIIRVSEMFGAHLSPRIEIYSNWYFEHFILLIFQQYSRLCPLPIQNFNWRHYFHFPPQHIYFDPLGPLRAHRTTEICKFNKCSVRVNFKKYQNRKFYYVEHVLFKNFQMKIPPRVLLLK